MATCRKVTLTDRIAATERETGRKVTADERHALALSPPQYTCTGPGVAGLAGRKPKTKRRRR